MSAIWKRFFVQIDCAGRTAWQGLKNVAVKLYKEIERLLPADPTDSALIEVSSSIVLPRTRMQPDLSRKAA